MLGEELRDAVGPGKGNHPNDVRLVQRLLDRNTGLVGRTITLTGEFDAATEVAILDFQRKVMRQAFPSGIISPGDETFWRLVETRPRRMLAGALGGIILAPFTGDPDFREDDFKDAAKSLGCEARSIKAVKAVESPFGPFDKAGRPTILFERHLFSQLTLRRYDGRYPMISNRLPGGYSFPERDQYVRLQQAYALNADAALKAASWGGFQILGMNHLAAGYRTVDQFVRAMCQSAVLQKDAFVSFIKADSRLLRGIREKDWALFARYYNGPAYAKNRYDTRLAEEYENATE